jgi:hypothetical protein
MNNLQPTCDWIQHPYPGNEVLVAPSTTHFIEGLDLTYRTIEKHPQGITKPSCMTIETREPYTGTDSLHVPVLLTPRMPSVAHQSRQEIQTLPLQWEVEMDCIERTSSLEADGGINGCNYTLFDGKPVTHVYLPHVMRENGPGCRRFEAHRAESEIARIRSSRIEKNLGSTQRAQGRNSACRIHCFSACCEEILAKAARPSAMPLLNQFLRHRSASIISGLRLYLSSTKASIVPLSIKEGLPCSFPLRNCLSSKEICLCGMQ